MRFPPTLTSSVSDRSFCLRSFPPWRRARISTTSAPTLWRVLLYSSPGLPRPTTSRSADAPVRGLRRNRAASPPRPKRTRPRRPRPSPASPSAPSTSSPSAASASSGRSIPRGWVTWATSSPGSCVVTTPGGSFSSPTRSWSPIVRCDTSASMAVGSSVGLASIERVKLVCSTMPPSFTPCGSPVRWIGTSAATATSRLTRMKSTCISVVPHRMAHQLAGEHEFLIARQVEADQRVDATRLRAGCARSHGSAPPPAVGSVPSP